MSFKLMCWDHARYVKNTSRPYDEMAREMARKKAIGIETVIVYMAEVINLDVYCKAAAENGIAVQAWITPKIWISNPVTRFLPEAKWLEMEKRHGIRLSSPCPNHPHNRQSMIANTMKLAEEYAGRVEAIHLDAIRTENALLTRDFPCECEACRALRKRFLGYEILSEDDLKNPGIIYKELDWKNSSISEIVQAVKAIADKNNLRLTMAGRANYLNQPDIEKAPVWGLGPAVMEGQDWVKWSDNGWVDEIYTMNYHTDKTLFTRVLNEHIRLLRGSGAGFYSGIGVESSMGKNQPEQVAEYIQKVKALGLNGCVFFNKTDVFEPEYEAVIKASRE